jgi:hypothetical protein
MKRLLAFMGHIANVFEVVIAVLLLGVIAIRVVEIFMVVIGGEIVILNIDFDRLLSIAFALVIGVEFTKMLCKHTPETVIDVLLFAIARQTIIYQEGTVDMLLGVTAIIGLFAAKKYFLKKKDEKVIRASEEV